MDILQLIPSWDMRKHLKKIAYKFSPSECAWLVHQSKKTLLTERHAAWQEIIDTMPDCEIDPASLPDTHLHDFLSYLIKFEKNLLAKFFETNTRSIYRYIVIPGQIIFTDVAIGHRRFSHPRRIALQTSFPNLMKTKLKASASHGRNATEVAK